MSTSEKQRDFLTRSTARVNITEGSIRSGKTIIGLLRWLFFVSDAPRGGELVMVGRTRDTVWRNNLLPLQNPDLYGELAEHVLGNYGAPTARILGRTVHVLGASDAKAEKVIRGMTVAGAHVDEVTVIPEEFFTQLLGRMSVQGAKLFGSTNPDNPAHWLKKKYLDRVDKLDSWRAWHFSLEDNPSLTEEYKTSIRSEFTGLWYRRFVLGEWVAAEGAIFDAWDPDVHVVPWTDMPPMARFAGVGIDYGTTNATSAVLLGQDRTGGYWAVDEWRYDPSLSQRRLTDQQLATKLRTWLLDKHTPHTDEPFIPTLAVDPAAASFKVELTNMGLPVVNADNDVTAGIRVIASMLGAGQLHVTDRCAGVINEAPGYSWDPKATEKGQDAPIKTADHSLDALRYARMIDPHDLTLTGPAVAGLG